MEVEDLVQSTVKIIKDTKVPPEATSVAFEKIFDLLSGAKPRGTTRDTTRDEPDGDTDDPLEKIAQRLHVDLATVEKVFDFHGGELNLAISANKLSSSKSRATGEIALLLAAGRQAIGLDGAGTHVTVIREAAKNYKRLDGPNFATSIGALDKTMTVRGSGRDRSLKMTTPAWSSAAELVQKLTDG